MKQKQVIHPFPGAPGKYHLKMAYWLPKVQVTVFQHTLVSNNDWRCRIGGMMFNPEKWLTKGDWEGPLSNPAKQ